MTDLEMTKLCAEAIGFYENQEDFTDPGGEVFAELSDYPVRQVSQSALGRSDPMSAGGVIDVYDPLHDDAQAMALVKKFDLTLGRVKYKNDASPIGDWMVCINGRLLVDDPDLNRAIVECVARMQESKLTQ